MISAINRTIQIEEIEAQLSRKMDDDSSLESKDGILSQTPGSDSPTTGRKSEDEGSRSKFFSSPWSGASWQDGSRKSAFQPYRVKVLNNIYVCTHRYYDQFTCIRTCKIHQNLFTATHHRTYKSAKRQHPNPHSCTRAVGCIIPPQSRSR
jgi:hypothetical protein